MNTFFQGARAAKYIFFAIAAVVSIAYPSAIVLSSIGTFAYFWSILFLLGAIPAAAGILTKTWVGEYVGLPAIIASLLLYSAGCFIDTANFTTGRLFLGMIFLGFAMSSYARLNDVKFQKRVADYEKRVRDGKPGL